MDKQKELTRVLHDICRHPLYIGTFTDKFGNFIPPKLVLDIGNPEVNAYAEQNGDGSCTVIINEGALNAFTTEELIPIIGHELCHIKYRDKDRINEVSILRLVALIISFFVGLFVGKATYPEVGFVASFIILVISHILVETALYNIFKAQEIRADRYGAGVGGLRPMIDVVKKLGIFSLEKNYDWISKFFNRFKHHPLFEQRVLLLQALRQSQSQK